MKKMKILGIALLAPLTLLCACTSTPSLAMSSNWSSDPTTDLLSGAKETLEYAVTFVPPTSPLSFGVEYDEGTYTTTLKLTDTPYSLSDGSQVTVYEYTTVLNVPVRYTYGENKSETYYDTVTTVTHFRQASDTTRPFSPIDTTLEMNATLLESADPKSLEEVYQSTYFYRETKYSLDLTKATVSTKSAKEDNPETPQKEDEVKTTEIQMDYEGTYLDNDQLLCALRAIDLSGVISFSSIDPQTNLVATVSTASSESLEYELKDATIGGVLGNYKINAYKFNIGYEQTMAGSSRTMYYAAKASSSSNTYRNVLLQMDTPLSYGLGTLRYTLKNATFA